MAQPRDYRKPRNQEMRDLLVHLPHPVKVVDGSGLLLWQNQAAERLKEEPTWVEHPTTWQGHKANLVMPLLVEDKPSPLVAELEVENERLRRHQRDTARRKKKAEDTAKQSEKAVDDVGKREQKLRQQLEAAQRQVAELEQAAEQAGRGKGKKGKGKGSLKETLPEKAQDLQTEELQPEKGEEKPVRPEKSAESSLRSWRSSPASATEESAAELRADLHALKTSDARRREENARLQESQQKLDEEYRDLQRQLNAAEARYSALQAEYEAFRAETEEEESRRQLEDQLAAKVREFEELERTFEEEQKAFQVQKEELQSRLSEQEGEFSKLKESVYSTQEEAAPEESHEQELQQLRQELEEAQSTISQAAKREARLSEKLEGANDLKEEQSKVLVLLKDELREIRERERDLREATKSFGELRRELEQVRSDAQKQRAELEELRITKEQLEGMLSSSRQQLAEARASAPVSRGISLRDVAPSDAGSATMKSQLEFAQSRLRDTEKQLDETLEALKKARAEAHSSKDTEKLAFEDTLTGLPNRHIVDRYLDFAHKQARSTDRAYSLFLIDIDGFRVLNETFGREWGDALLVAVAERLAGMRGANHIFARHSQDRFLLLAADLARPASEKFVEDASRTLLDAMAHPFEVKGETIKLTGSIGIALGPANLEDPRETFGQAEVALATAKARGAGSYFLHNEALQQKAVRDNTYLRQMQQAISRHEFHAVYQPVFNLHKGQVMSTELLLRWNHRDQRVLRPEEFLEVAVRSGLIFGIVDAIWPQAFRALARWRKLRPGVTLSVNLSDRELLNPRLVERALSCAQKAQVEPSAILFEVRDDSRLRLSSAWWTVLGALHQAGFGLVLDDYGSEASMFGTLAYSGFRQAKIVVVDEKNPQCTPPPTAAKGILYCAKAIQARFDPRALRKAGFDLAQGNAVAQPLDEDDVDGVLS